MFGEIAHSFQQGNIYLMIMLVVAFLAFIIIFERFIMLQFVFNINFEKFIANLKKMLNAEDLDRAGNFCKSVSNTSLPYIARRAIEAADTDPTTIKGTIEEETIGFLPRLEARVNFLVSLTTIVMFVGILGTIDSLWSTFHAIDVLDSTKKQVAISQEVASALNPIAFGLMLSMIILVSHQLIRGMAVRVTDRIHHGVTILTNLMVPQEMAAFVPSVAATASAAAVAAISEDTKPSAEAGTQTTEGSSADANFDDASVQDIRDEEEII